MSAGEYEGSVHVRALGSWYEIEIQIGSLRVVEARGPTLQAACDMAAAGLANSLFRQVSFMMGTCGKLPIAPKEPDPAELHAQTLFGMLDTLLFHLEEKEVLQAQQVAKNMRVVLEDCE